VTKLTSQIDQKMDVERSSLFLFHRVRDEARQEAEGEMFDGILLFELLVGTTPFANAVGQVAGTGRAKFKGDMEHVAFDSVLAHEYDTLVSHLTFEMCVLILALDRRFPTEQTLALKEKA
jgi:hypothetical protein